MLALTLKNLKHIQLSNIQYFCQKCKYPSVLCSGRSTTYVNYDKIIPCSQLYLGFTSSLFFTLNVLTEFMGSISAVLPFSRSDSIFAARHKEVYLSLSQRRF